MMTHDLRRLQRFVGDDPWDAYKRVLTRQNAENVTNHDPAPGNASQRVEDALDDALRACKRLGMTEREFNAIVQRVEPPEPVTSEEWTLYVLQRR